MKLHILEIFVGLFLVLFITQIATQFDDAQDDFDDAVDDAQDDIDDAQDDVEDDINDAEDDINDAEDDVEDDINDAEDDIEDDIDDDIEDDIEDDIDDDIEDDIEDDVDDDIEDDIEDDIDDDNIATSTPGSPNSTQNNDDDGEEQDFDTTEIVEFAEAIFDDRCEFVYAGSICLENSEGDTIAVCNQEEQCRAIDNGLKFSISAYLLEVDRKRNILATVSSIKSEIANKLVIPQENVDVVENTPQRITVQLYAHKERTGTDLAEELAELVELNEIDDLADASEIVILNDFEGDNEVIIVGRESSNSNMLLASLFTLLISFVLL